MSNHAMQSFNDLSIANSKPTAAKRPNSSGSSFQHHNNYTIVSVVKRKQTTAAAKTTAVYLAEQNDKFIPNFYNPFEIKRRKRTTQEQAKALEQAFQINPKPTAKIRHCLAKRLSMSARCIQIWFQNRRAKEKKRQQQQSKSVSNNETDQQQKYSADYWKQHTCQLCCTISYNNNTLTAPLTCNHFVCYCSNETYNTSLNDDNCAARVLLYPNDMVHSRSQSSSISSSSSLSYSPPATMPLHFNPSLKQQSTPHKTSIKDFTVSQEVFATANSPMLPLLQQQLSESAIILAAGLDNKHSHPNVVGLLNCNLDSNGAYHNNGDRTIASKIGAIVPTAPQQSVATTTNSNIGCSHADSYLANDLRGDCSPTSIYPSYVYASLPQHHPRTDLSFEATYPTAKSSLQKRYSCPAKFSFNYSIDPALLQQFE